MGEEISDVVFGLKEWAMILGEDRAPVVKYVATDYHTKSTKTVNPEDFYLAGFNIRFFKYEKGYEVLDAIYRRK